MYTRKTSSELDPKEIIQLMPAAVSRMLPPDTTEDEMFEALDGCGMTVEEIFEEVERRCNPNWKQQAPEDAQHVADAICDILYDNFNRCLLKERALHGKVECWE